MKLYGLLGKQLGHSFSQKYFTEKFTTEKIAAAYNLFPMPVAEWFTELPRLFPDLCGLNVTVPYKQDVIPFLHEIDQTAQKIGAVNTIKVIRTQNSFRLKGYNTDWVGFLKPLSGLLKKGDKVLILGTGGAAKAVAYAVETIGCAPYFVSRSGKAHFSYSSLTETDFGQFRLVVNTSPLGTFPDVNTAPEIPYNVFSEKQIAYDLVYNPAQTLFLKKALLQNAHIINGLPMLMGQAEAAWEIWNK